MDKPTIIRSVENENGNGNGVYNRNEVYNC